MKLHFASVSAVFAVLATSAGCAAPAEQSASTSDGIRQPEVLELTSANATKLVASLDLAGIATDNAWTGYKTYAAEAWCTGGDACSLKNTASSAVAPTDVTLAAAAATDLFALLTTVLPVEADGSVNRATLRCSQSFTGATINWSSCTVTHTVDKAAPNETSRTTGVGATLRWGSITEYRSWSSVNLTDTNYELTYEDTAAYFGNADSVSARIVETTAFYRDGVSDAPQTRSYDVTLAKIGDHKYRGLFNVTLLTDYGHGGYATVQLNRLAVALHVGSTWDSAMGANYTLR